MYNMGPDLLAVQAKSPLPVRKYLSLEQSYNEFTMALRAK